MCYFYNDLSTYASFGGVVIARDEGDRIAAALGPSKKNIILQNHGLMTTGSCVGEAAAYFIALERACYTQLLAEAAAASGIPKISIPEDQVAQNKKICTSGFMYMQFVPEYNLSLRECKDEFLE